MGIILDKLTGNPLLIEVKEADLDSSVQGKLNSTQESNSIKIYGAVGDGATDDTTAIQLAIDTNTNVYVPDGIYLVSNLVLKHGTYLHGDGWKSILKLKSGATGNMIYAGANGKNVVVENLHIYGGDETNKNIQVADGNINGLVINPSTQSKIHNLWIHGFTGSGLKLISTYTTNDNGVLGANSVANTGNTTNFSNINSYNNYFGFNISQSGCEYLVFSNLEATACRYGFYNIAGNIYVTSSFFEVCYYGIYIDGVNSSNNGHGIFSGCSSNHNDYSIYADSITNGHNFSGCCFFGGIMYFKDSSGINITGGSMSQFYYRFAGVGAGSVLSSVPLTNSGGLVLATYNSHLYQSGDTVIVSGTTDYDGTWVITKINNDTFTLNSSTYTTNKTATITRQSGRNVIKNNFIGIHYGDVIQHNYGGSTSNTVMIDNFKADGSVVGDATDIVNTQTQTDSYTLVLSDRGKKIDMNKSTANNLTIPLDKSVLFPIGTQIFIRQLGAGTTTIVATSGVTLQSAGNKVAISAQYGVVQLIKEAENTWSLFGNLA